jgi:carboxyl-terminal processing protease
LVLFLGLFLWISLPHAVAAAPATLPAKGEKMGSVGLQVVPIASGEIVVIALLENSPAARAKLLPGDLIIAVDGKALRGSDFADVTKSRLWGKAGSTVKLTWLRPGVAGKQSAQLVRGVLTDDPARDLAVEMLVPAATNPAAAAKP